MEHAWRIDLAIELLAGFAERTGLGSAREPRRYLWTDAFAVCTYLGLARSTGDASFRELALALVEQVHHVLGRFRPDDARSGWISGLGEAAGAAHPTRGGLRIGKALPERTADEPYDAELEWERDGQYFHYLTKWMHALAEVAREVRSERHALWARELAVAAHAGFVRAVPADARKRMIWKASTDLSRPLVPSMGQHDPLDGYVTCLELGAASGAGPDLAPLAADYRAMLASTRLVSADPLGLGGLLTDAHRLVRIGREAELAAALLDAAAHGLQAFAAEFDPRTSPARRLAFRELGLALGLRAARELAAGPGTPAAVRSRAVRLAEAAPLGAALEALWATPASRAMPAWAAHADIDDVMLAACLVPQGFLGAPDA